MGATLDEQESPSTETAGSPKRRYPRSEEFEARHISVELRDYGAPVFAGSSRQSRRTRVVGAEMLDMNPTGIGVKSPDPLAVGSIVSVGGEVFSDGAWMKFEGRCRVAHCRCQDDGSFRVGLNFTEVKQQDLD